MFQVIFLPFSTAGNSKKACRGSKNRRLHYSHGELVEQSWKCIYVCKQKSCSGFLATLDLGTVFKNEYNILEMHFCLLG